MANRTDPTAVRSLVQMPEAYDPTPHIDMANTVVNRIAVADTAGDLTEILVHIETLLSCHYYTLRDPIYKSRSVGRASASFMDRNFWNEAKQLDTTGTLASMETGARARIIWGGLPENQRPSWQDQN